MLLADKVKKTGDRIQTWWNNEKHPAGTYWTAYTVLFLALFSVIAMGFFIIGKFSETLLAYRPAVRSVCRRVSFLQEDTVCRAWT